MACSNCSPPKTSGPRSSSAIVRGIGYGEVKNRLAEVIIATFTPAREATRGAGRPSDPCCRNSRRRGRAGAQDGPDRSRPRPRSVRGGVSRGSMGPSDEGRTSLKP